MPRQKPRYHGWKIRFVGNFWGIKNFHFSFVTLIYKSTWKFSVFKNNKIQNGFKHFRDGRHESAE